jgi:hypothetical protein
MWFGEGFVSIEARALTNHIRVLGVLMNLKNITKKMHDAVCTSDEEDTKVAPAASKPADRPQFDLADLQRRISAGPASAAPATDTNSPFAVPGTVVLDDAVYQRVLDKTNFEKTQPGQIIHKYYEALEESGMDANARFKTAMKQASKLEGVTADKVLQTFDDLKTALQAEGDKFARAVDNQSQKEIVGRQQRLQQISDQISQLTQQQNDLQTQHTQISAELADANNQVTSAQTQMQLAMSRRSQEIDTQKAQFTGLLR